MLTAGGEHSRRRWWIVSGAALVVFALGAWVLFLPLSLTDSQHLPTCACADQALQVWFLAADHYAAVHNHFSMFSDRLDYPTGVNLLDNTSMPLLGFLAGPLFGHIGPVGVFNLLMRLGFFLSAASCFFVLRTYVRSGFAAFIGAGLYAFGPFMSHQGIDHVFLIFAPIPPILVMLVDRHLAGSHRRVVVGVSLGLLGVAQYFISSETFVSLLVVLGLTVVILSALQLLRRRPVVPIVRQAAPSLAVAALIIVACLAYPAWFATHGPQHLTGPTQPVPGDGNGLLNTLFPVTRSLLGSRVFGVGSKYDVNGDMGYLGFPLVILLVGAVIRLRRVPIVQFAAVLGAVSWVLSLGPRLVIGAKVTKIPLPFAVFDRFPLLQDIITGRFSLTVDLAAGIILAVAVDRLLDLAHEPGRSPRLMWRGRATAAVVGILGLLFVLPVTGYGAPSTTVASEFLNGRATRYIPENGVVLAYPYPQPPEANAMIWQADAGLKFRLLGGYAVRPATNPRRNKIPSLLSPAAPQEYFMQAWPATLPGARRVTLRAAEVAFPAFVRRYHVTTIVVQASGGRFVNVERLCRQVFGTPVRLPGLLIWPDLKHPARLRHRRVRRRRSGAGAAISGT